MTGEVVRHSLSDTLTDGLLALIREQGLRPGDRLPAARALAQRFAVATPTVREALRRLQALGTIEIRHGSGVYVSSTVDRLLVPNPGMTELPGDRLLQLLDARLVIEPHLAGLAARRHGEPAVAELSARLSRAAAMLTGDDERLHEANMSFHAAIAAAAGNSVLYEVMDSLLAVHNREQREILRIFDDRSRDHDEHAAILAAVERGDRPGAERLMRDHLTEVKDVIAARVTPSKEG